MADNAVSIQAAGRPLPPGQNWLAALGEEPPDTVIRIAENLVALFPPEHFGMFQDGFMRQLSEKLHSSKWERSLEVARALVGQNCGMFQIWWAYNYCHLYRTYRMRGMTYQRANEEISEVLGFEDEDTYLMLSNSVISALVNVFFDRFVEDMRGMVGFEILISALNGDPRFAQLYQGGYNKARMKDGADVQIGIVIDETKLPTDELKAKIAKLRKDTGGSIN